MRGRYLVSQGVYRERDDLWSPEEEAALAEHYPTHGADWAGWEDLLDGRTRLAIGAKARKMHLTSPKHHRRWGPGEDAKLARHYPDHGADWDGWEGLLPGRSRRAIQCRAQDLGVRMEHRCANRPGSYSQEEDDAIIRHYPLHGAAWDGWGDVGVRRTAASLRSRACRLGVTYRARGRNWSPEEDAELAKVADLVARRMGRLPKNVAKRMASVVAHGGEGAE